LKGSIADSTRLRPERILSDPNRSRAAGRQGEFLKRTLLQERQHRFAGQRTETGAIASAWVRASILCVAGKDGAFVAAETAGDASDSSPALAPTPHTPEAHRIAFAETSEQGPAQPAVLPSACACPTSGRGRARKVMTRPLGLFSPPTCARRFALRCGARSIHPCGNAIAQTPSPDSHRAATSACGGKENHACLLAQRFTMRKSVRRGRRGSEA